MADPPAGPDRTTHAHDGTGRNATGEWESRDAPPDTPRWVKLSGIIAAVLVVVFLIVHLASGGLGDHMPPAVDHPGVRR